MSEPQETGRRAYVPRDLEIRDSISETEFPQLMALLGTTWWARHRTPDGVRQMLAASTIVVALVARGEHRLVGFARVLTDFTYIALILDVVVDPDLRGHGLGVALMDAVVGHPRLADVQSVELVCQPELQPFYRRWGFTDSVGASRLMRRTPTR